ncbi:MAG: DUF5916 domain-containing protein [Luteimonas sp.]
MRLIPCCFAAACLLIPAFAASAAGELRLDGIADEALWRDAQVFDDFRVTSPYTLDPATHPTRALLRSLPEGLAVAFVVEQPRDVPRLKPRAGRDANVDADRVNFSVDFDGDGRLAYNFMVTLGNAIADEVVSNENSYNADWDGVWQYALHEEEDRWSVEMLIPWSVAAMREADGPTRTIGVNFDRVLASRGERSASAPVSYTRPRYVSEFTRVQVQSHPPRGYLSVVPYASMQHDLIDGGNDGRAGVDVFWKPSGQFQLSAALNPDFGQVEADDLVVDFDAVEVFFSDKRPFFTENQGIFDLRTPDDGRLVYTRRFGGPDDRDGRISDIDAALKLNGSVAGFDYGTLAVLEAEHADDLGRLFLVQRLQREVGTLSLGWLGTWTDRPALDRRATVQAVDAIWRPDPRWLVSGQVLTSSVREDGNDQRGSGAWLTAAFAPDARLEHELELVHFDRHLDFNDAGYQRRGSYNALAWSSLWRVTGFDADDWRRSIAWEFEPLLHWNDSGQRLPPELELGYDLRTRSGASWQGELVYSWRGYDDLVSRGNGTVVQQPRLQGLEQTWERPRTGNWAWQLGGTVLQEGDDGYAIQPEATVRWFPRDDVDLSLLVSPLWSQDWLIWEQDTLFSSYRRRQLQLDVDMSWYPGSRHELRLKAQWIGIDAHDPTPFRIGAGGHLVESSDEVAPFTVNSFGLQLRYRYEFGPQRELYVVYGRGGQAQALQPPDDGDGDRYHRGLGSLFGDIGDLRDAEQVLVKLRWGF